MLTEAEWRALRDVEPDAVGWLQERIRERLGSPSSGDAPQNGPFPSAASAASAWDHDEY